MVTSGMKEKSEPSTYIIDISYAAQLHLEWLTRVLFKEKILLSSFSVYCSPKAVKFIYYKDNTTKHSKEDLEESWESSLLGAKTLSTPFPPSPLWNRNLNLQVGWAAVTPKLILAHILSPQRKPETAGERAVELQPEGTDRHPPTAGGGEPKNEHSSTPEGISTMCGAHGSIWRRGRSTCGGHTTETRVHRAKTEASTEQEQVPLLFPPPC